MTTKKSTSTLFGRRSASLLFLMAITALLILCAPGVAARAQADDRIGSITSNGDTVTYETYADLQQALENLENEDVTVEMFDNWTRTEALVIPPNSRVTLNMNGHVLDRALSALDPCEGLTTAKP